MKIKTIAIIIFAVLILAITIIFSIDQITKDIAVYPSEYVVFKDFNPVIKFEGYTEEEIKSAKIVLLRNNLIIDSCIFSNSFGGVEHNLGDKLKYSTSFVFERSDSIMSQDTILLSINTEVHKIYDVEERGVMTNLYHGQLPLTGYRLDGVDCYESGNEFSVIKK